MGDPPHASILAWRAFLRAIRLAERHAEDVEATRHEAHDFALRAVETGPGSSIALSLASHVHCLVRGDVDTAGALVRRSLELDPTSRSAGASWRTSPASAAITGGRGSSRCGPGASPAPGPFAFVFDGLCCITAAMCQDYESALLHAAAASAMSAGFAVPVRYRYAIHAHLGDERRAAEAFDQLRRQDPGFHVDLLHGPHPTIRGHLAQSVLRRQLH